MKNKYKNLSWLLNVLSSVILTWLILYSSNIGQDISSIYTDYTIDTNTLNNSLITLNIIATRNDDISYKEFKNKIDDQMMKFNNKYEKLETKEVEFVSKKRTLDNLVYLLIALSIIGNTIYGVTQYKSEL